MGKELKLSKKDLKEIEKDIELNKIQRLQFIDMYTDWIKKTPNKVWSAQHKKFIDKD